MKVSSLQFSVSSFIAAAAGVIVFDLLFCGMIAPKVLQAIRIAQLEKRGCGCGCKDGSCAKDITDRAQVIDLSEVKVQGVSVSV